LNLWHFLTERRIVSGMLAFFVIILYNDNKRNMKEMW
jgi:hypothetical protein